MNNRRKIPGLIVALTGNAIQIGGDITSANAFVEFGGMAIVFIGITIMVRSNPKKGK